MAKTKVVIIGIADWAGSALNVCRAVNSIGEFESRLITTYKHPFEYPKDILVHIFPINGNMMVCDAIHKSINSDQYEEACDVLEDADIIHTWNSLIEPDFLANGLPLRFSKIKVVTWTGSAYRRDHIITNNVSRQFDQWKTVVQDPMLKFQGEIESEFIPHAVDVNALVPQDNRKNKIATYRPNYKSNVRHAPEDIAKLYDFIKKYPGWEIDLDYSMPHPERMKRLAECSIAVQDLSPDIGFWGRSTLEACALGIPCMQNYNQDKVIQGSEGRLGEIPIVNVQDGNIQARLATLIEIPEKRQFVGQLSRNWVIKHFSYPVIGRMYSDVYRQVV